MTRTGRAFLGATIGALLTLLLHPISRPYLTGTIAGPSPELLRGFDAGIQKPFPPVSVREAAHWTEIAAEKMIRRSPFTQKELSSLRALMAEAQRRDPRNAFWRQMYAVFANRSGRESEAQASWIAGSKCTIWNDYQSEELRDEYDQLKRLTHETQGWQLAYMYRRRLTAGAQLIENLARILVGKTDLRSPESLALRYATVTNGSLLREGSQNVAIGQIGATIVELGAYPADLAGRRSPKRLLLGENDLFNGLNYLGRNDWAVYVQQQFNSNEAWQALSTTEMAEDEARDLGVTALLLAELPGAIFFVGLVGLVVWGLGEVSSRTFSGKRFGWIFPIVCGLVLGLTVFSLTSFIAAAVASTLCGVFLAVSPKEQRSTRRKEFGPTFSFTIATLASAAGISLMVYLISGSGPAVGLLPFLPLPTEYFGSSPLFIGLSVLFFSMIFLVTPFWGMAQHLPTPFVFSEGMKRFGATLIFSSLALTVISGPIAVYADQRASVTLRALLLNEPVYYHLRNETGT
jgi:hypothetical protein